MDDFSQREVEVHRARAASYDEDVTDVYRKAREFLLGTVIDVGCGTGVVSLALAERGFGVVAIDPFLRDAGDRRAEGLRGRTVGADPPIQGDVRLPFGDEAFDGATRQGLLHHLESMEPCISEIDRALRPGGFYYLSEPTSGETPLKRGLFPIWQTFHRKAARRATSPVESVEAPIDWSALARILDSRGLPYEAVFLTHLPRLRGHVPERARLLLTKLVSFSWRRSRGDIAFVYGRKPAP